VLPPITEVIQIRQTSRQLALPHVALVLLVRVGAVGSRRTEPAMNMCRCQSAQPSATYSRSWSSDSRTRAGTSIILVTGGTTSGIVTLTRRTLTRVDVTSRRPGARARPSARHS
jgi:hypothetical protein